MADSSWNPDWNRPTRLILHGNKDLASEHRGDAKRALFQLKNMQRTNPYQNTLRKQAADGSDIKVHTKVNGMDVIEITSYGGMEWEFVEETTTSKIVPIVELSESSQDVVPESQEYQQPVYYQRPVGFVAYNVVGPGDGEANGTWGGVIGYVSRLNEDSNIDPVGPVDGQSTFRPGWCFIRKTMVRESETEKVVIEITVEQMPRIDGGIYAYAGDIENSYWGDCDYATAIEVGYRDDINGGESSATWTPGYFPDYAMFGVPSTTLFFRAAGGYECQIPSSITAYWPEYLRQKKEYIQTQDWYSFFRVQSPISYDEDSDETYVFSRRTYIQNTTIANHGVWGIMWPDPYSYVSYRDVNMSHTPPFTTPEPGPTYASAGEYFDRKSPAGVFVYDDMSLWIAASTLRGARNISGWEAYKRNPRDIDTHFVLGVLTPPSGFEDVMDGNTSAMTFPDDLYYPSGTTTACKPYVGDCSRKTGEYIDIEDDAVEVVATNDGEYVVCATEMVEGDSKSPWVAPNISTHMRFPAPTYLYDTGIFASSSDKGDSGYQRVAFTFAHFQDSAPTHVYDSDIQQKVRFGIIINGILYVRDPLATAYDDEKEFHYVTPTGDFKGENGEDLYETLNIRAGIKKTTTKIYRRKLNAPR